MTIPLSAEDRILLKNLHRSLKDKKKADRLKIIIMLDKGYSNVEIAEILFLDTDTISKWHDKFLSSVSFGEFLNFQYHKHVGKLSENQILIIKKYLTDNNIFDSKQVVKFIEDSFGIHYSPSGIKCLLHRIGFSYKYLVKFNSKADVEKQEAFVEEFKKMQENLDNTSSILFLDAVHPQHNTGSVKAWVEKGKDKFIECNTGRQRLNINGAYNPMTGDTIIEEGDCINSENTIRLFQKIEDAYPNKKIIYAIADNARYYKSKQVKEYLLTSKIKLIHIPPYCPNLNLIERLWKFLRIKVIHTTYYPEFQKFKESIKNFFQNISDFRDELISFIGLKIHVVYR